MSKWIKTSDGTYLNSFHIRSFYVFESGINRWDIQARVDPYREREGFSSKATIYTIDSFDSAKEATDALEEIINGLEMEGK